MYGPAGFGENPGPPVSSQATRVRAIVKGALSANRAQPAPIYCQSGGERGRAPAPALVSHPLLWRQKMNKGFELNGLKQLAVQI